MIIKLAELVEPLRDDRHDSVKGDHLLLGNYAHPAVIGGGILGGWAGNETLDRIMPKTEKVVLETAKRKFMGIPFGTKITGAKIVSSNGGAKRNLAWGIARGLFQAVGAGTAAYGVKKIREHEDAD